MAYAHVQDTNSNPTGGGTSGTVTGAFGSNVTGGNLLIVPLNSQNGATVTSVNDTVGTPYSLAINADGSTGFGAIYFGKAAASGANTVTVVYASNVGNTVLGLFEFSGNASSSPLDKTAESHQTVSSTSITSGNTATTTNANELLFGFITNCNGSAGEAGWTAVVTGNGDIFEYKIVSATGAYAATGTNSPTFTYDAMIATFLPASGPTPVNATVSVAGIGAYSHGGRLLNNAAVSI